jgi:exopolysaccharide biosynthesis polyprenyl glycosylphosphotransferase
LRFFTRTVLRRFQQTLDIVVLVLASLIAYMPSLADPSLSAVLYLVDVKVKLYNVAVLALFSGFWLLIFQSFALHEIPRLRGSASEIKDVVKAVSLGTLAYGAAAVLSGRGYITRDFLILFWLSAIALSILSRWLTRFFFFRLQANAANFRKVVVVGSGRRGRALMRKLAERRDLGFSALGFVDDPPQARSGRGSGSSTSGPLQIGEFRHLCTLQEFPAYLERSVVDEVFIALPFKSYYEQITRIARACEDMGVTVRIPSDLFDLRISRSRTSEIDGEPVITFYTGQRSGAALAAKRALDVAVSGALLLALAPFLLAVAAAIRLASPGPVFFRQERVGYNKRRFRMLKFRTMVEGAEEQQESLEELNQVEGPVFKIWHDPRITPLGRFLRRTSLDELPQLWNVFRGEMSLVGPRPLPIRDVERFDQAWLRRRFTVKPGITCLWQVNGRSRTNFNRWIQQDLEYIDNWSLGLDLKILAKTLPAVARGDGAA